MISDNGKGFDFKNLDNDNDNDNEFIEEISEGIILNSTIAQNNSGSNGGAVCFYDQQGRWNKHPPAMMFLPGAR